MQVENVERPINNFVQVFISPQVAAIVHSNYWQVALAFIYVYMYTVVSRKRAQYQISAHPPLLLQFPAKI